MLSSFLAGVKCSRTLQSTNFLPGRLTISARSARTKFQRTHIPVVQARLSTNSRHSATAAPRTGSLSSLSELLRFNQSSSVWSRWYRSKNDAIAARARRASQGSAGGSFRSEPPFKRWFNNQPGEFVVYGILAINGAIYVGWMYATDMFKAGHPELYIKMCKNVLLSWQNIKEGRIWTIITSTFSHSGAAHFLLNAITFYYMAPPVIRMLGNTSFMALYLIGGISCSVVSLLLNKSVRNRDGASNGASGAIFAVMTFFACVAPRTRFYLFLVVPVPAWVVVGGLFIWDGISTITDRKTQVDGAGHVGGILAGLAYFVMKMRGL